MFGKKTENKLNNSMDYGESHSRNYNRTLVELNGNEHTTRKALQE